MDSFAFQNCRSNVMVTVAIFRRDFVIPLAPLFFAERFWFYFIQMFSVTILDKFMIQDLRQGQGHCCYFREKKRNYLTSCTFIYVWIFILLHTNTCMSKYIMHLVRDMVGPFITFRDCQVFSYFCFSGEHIFNQKWEKSLKSFPKVLPFWSCKR